MSGADADALLLVTEPVAEPPTRWFVDIAAQRIQTWLGRSDRLRMRRGASYRLATITSREAIDMLLADHVGELGSSVTWNVEAGEISGVVPLCFPTVGLTEAQARRLARQAARIVAAHIRATLCHCPLAGLWGSGTSYVEAYLDMRSRAEAGNIVLDFAGDADEIVLARACQGCRQARAAWPAVPIVKEQRRDLCPDCGARFAGAGWSSMPIPLLPHSQRELVRALNKLLPKEKPPEAARVSTGEGADRYPEDFEDLAKRGAVRLGDAATQLALIYADGNRIGDKIEAWVDRGGRAAGDPSVTVPKQDIVRVLDHTTKTAIVSATRLTFPDWLDADPPEAPPVIVHLAGGDDVMVSVPAAYGWAFARHLLASFTGLSGEPVPAHLAPNMPDAPNGMKKNPLRLAFGGQHLPSLSIGMVFHHNSHPFADVVEKAESQLKDAKRAFKGEEPAIAFHDLTADGEAPPTQEQPDPEALVDAFAPPPPRAALAGGALAGWSQILDELSQVGRAHRTTLLTLLRECREGLTAAEDLGRRVETVADPAVLRSVRSWPGASEGAPVRDLLGKSACRNHLRLLLDVSRHWQPQGGQS